MRAMVLENSGEIDTAPLVANDVGIPEPGPGELLVAVDVCAVCRTDLHIIEGDLPRKRRPVIPGHQVVGSVELLGDGCTRFATGDRVGIAWLRSTDGTCRFCRSGRENLCASSRYTGYHEDGGYAQFTVVPEAFAYALPSASEARALAPLLCAGLIGYRALKRARTPERGKLLLVGFGSSAHIVLQLALHRGYAVYVVTRGDEHMRLATDMGAAWAGSDPARLPTKMDSAILFAPVGSLVPPTLAALDRGGTLAIAGIHLSQIPALDYEQHLFYDREIRSVAANTREDGRELLEEATEAGVEPHVITYDLEDANRALQDLKHSRVSGTGVLAVT